VRLAATIATTAALAASWTPAAGAKGELLTVRLCGEARCATAKLPLRLTDRYAWRGPPAATPFYALRVVSPTLRPGLRSEIAYAPGRAVWRVRLGGTLLWLDVPSDVQPALARAARTLAPCRAAATWRCARA
jgi:hypothetical protein